MTKTSASMAQLEARKETIMGNKTTQFANVINDIYKVLKTSSFSNDSYFLEIPSKKLANVRKSLAIGDAEEALGLFDFTVLGSAKHALAFTTWGLRYKLYEAWSVSWEELYLGKYILDTSGKEPAITVQAEKAMGLTYTYTITWLGAEIKNATLSTIIAAGVYIFGNKNDSAINTVEELAQTIKQSSHITATAKQEAVKDDKEEADDANQSAEESDEGEEEDAFVSSLIKGNDFFKLDNYEQAEECFSRAINEYNEEIHTKEQLAVAYMMFALSKWLHFFENIDKYATNDEITDKKAFFDLIADCKKAIEYNLMEASLYSCLGYCLYLLTLDKTDEKRQEYFNEALRYFDKGIELAPDDADYKKQRQELIDKNRDLYKSQPKQTIRRIPMSVEEIIKDNVKELRSTVYIAPSIDEKKLNNAVTAIAQGIDPSIIVAIVDTTLLGSAKTGLVFTGDTVYYRDAFANPVPILYSDIGKVEHKITEKTDEKGKTETTKIVDLFDKDDKIILNIEDPPFKHDKFCELLNDIIAAGGEEGDFQTSAQSQQLVDMDPSIKMAYVKVVCNYLHFGTENIDNKEYSEIISLIVKNNIDNEHRFMLRQYIMNKEGIEDNGSLVNFLVENVEEGSLKGLKTSLAQDIVSIFRVRERAKEDYDYSRWQNDGFIREIQKLLDVSDDQIDFFLEKLQSDEDIINKRQSNSDIEKTLKGLGAKAGAIGIPLAALYFSGSLWVYGGSLFLFGGLGPIAIAAGVGFLGYKGLKKLTGLSEIEANSQREIMLQGIIRNSQKSLNFLIEDVNYIAQKLADELSKGQAVAVMLEKLKRQLVMLSQGATTMSGRMNQAEKEAVIAKLPPKLDVRRFDELTNKPTLMKYRPIVMAGFIETQTKTADGTPKTEQYLNCDLSLNQLEELHGVLDNIGYFTLGSAAVASVKGLAKDLFGKR